MLMLSAKDKAPSALYVDDFTGFVVAATAVLIAMVIPLGKYNWRNHVLVDP